MIGRGVDIGAFEFVVLASRRAAQLARGCRPRVEGNHTSVVLARHEVAAGKVRRLGDPPIGPLRAGVEPAAGVERSLSTPGRAR